jgi:hypothetical protein
MMVLAQGAAGFLDGKSKFEGAGARGRIATNLEDLPDLQLLPPFARRAPHEYAQKRPRISEMARDK